MKTRDLYYTKRLVFPFVKKFTQSYEIREHEVLLDKTFGATHPQIKFASRIVAKDNCFWGLFWIDGEMPNNKEIRQMLSNEGFKFSMDEAQIYIGE